jgi:hypothetical protein
VPAEKCDGQWVRFFLEDAQRELVFFTYQRGDGYRSKYILPMLLKKKTIVFSPDKRDTKR